MFESGPNNLNKFFKILIHTYYVPQLAELISITTTFLATNLKNILEYFTAYIAKITEGKTRENEQHNI